MGIKQAVRTLERNIMKNHTTKNLRHSTSRLVVSLALACFLGVQLVSQAASTPFSRIVVFGDSLSDTGNFYYLTGNQLPPSPYANGRFSNGSLWIEYLAEDLGMQLLQKDNYAVAGATTGHLNSNDGVLGLLYPGLQDEISEFLASHQAEDVDPAALYIIWAGANDFFVTLESGGSPADLIAGGVNNTVHALQTLWSAGARYILVVNVPDLGITPYGLGSGMGNGITQLCEAYNQTLEAGLTALADAGIATIQVDSFATLEAMVNFPAQFDFTNVTESFIPAAVGDPAGFLFWDVVHPTTRGHEILADSARNQLINYFSARHGHSSPPALVNSLNGLVNAQRVNH
jgi:phospholipase/lecithinase/hemolysin